ncbi:unnamed protein product [Timema podura]|uniref:Uncharacterized protein n=1 Tax=Timema podura TaxID=61482 RepID=A0ABN7NW36_TIMPD|nr:unnamed protein product [Timema podura]
MFRTSAGGSLADVLLRVVDPPRKVKLRMAEYRPVPCPVGYPAASALFVTNVKANILRNSKSDLKIVGGEPTTINQFPHQVSLRSKEKGPEEFPFPKP